MLVKCLTCGKEINLYGKDVAHRSKPHCSKECRYDGPFHFWNAVDKSGICWIYTKSKTKAGYGLLTRRSGNIYAHRYAWELAKGPIPEGLEVCHNCPGGDNPACVNPGHLFLGTHKDNLSDAAKKGRMQVKLTPDMVRLIRVQFAAGGISKRSLAKVHGIAHSTLGSILKGKIWAHVSML